jgi:DNA-directed RNA polymerase subunit K
MVLHFHHSRRNILPYTRFEKARIIGARALQLSMGAPSTLLKIPKDLIDPVKIAMQEYEKEAIPITVKKHKD